MLLMIRTSGFKDSVCDNAFYNAPVTKLWAFAFTLSKAPELGEVSALPCNLLNVLASASEMLPNWNSQQGEMLLTFDFYGCRLVNNTPKQHFIHTHWKKNSVTL